MDCNLHGTRQIECTLNTTNLRTNKSQNLVTLNLGNMGMNRIQ